jgi:KUP system potassium uptake protein
MTTEKKVGPWLLALTAIGVVYGDIGTSPLYAFSIALHATGSQIPTPGDVLGIVSLIFWAIMLMVSLKYVVFVLRADNDGEGGILALLSLVEPEQTEGSTRLPIVVMLGVAGAALLYGDGVITPAISVLSAMEGLKLATPAAGPFIVPVTLAILVVLFVIQRHGTATIGRFFGPVMVTWFVVIGGLGVVNILGEPSVIRAINPLEAARFLSANPLISFAVFGAIFLTLTGGEALYADMGHVGAAAIRRAWFALVLPALLLNYFGQGALVLTDPKATENPFYRLAPSWALIPMIVLAGMATIIASQALISGIFSLTRQAIQMGFCPLARIVPTSSEEAGQVYVPIANWLLMVATLLIVVLFKSSANLAAAYGIAVSGTMLITTILLYRVMVTWWPRAVVVPIIVAFAVVDMVFLASNSLKIVDGGWIPIATGAAVATVMLSWHRGSSVVRRQLSDMSMPLAKFVDNIDKMVVTRVAGTGVWLTKVAHGASPMLLHHIRHNQVVHEAVVLLTHVRDRRPRVPFPERHSVHPLGNGCYHIQVRLGYMQTPALPLTLQNCQPLGFDADIENVHYYVARETVVRRVEGSAMGPIGFAVFAFLTRNASRAPDFFRIPNADVFEVGSRLEI